MIALTVFVAGSIRVSVPVPTVSAGQQRKPGRDATQIASFPTAIAVGTTTPSPIVLDTTLDSALTRITPASLPTHTVPLSTAIPDAPETPPAVPLLNPKSGPPTPNVATRSVAASIREILSCWEGLSTQTAPSPTARLWAGPEPKLIEPVPSGIGLTTAFNFGSIRATRAGPPPSAACDETSSQTALSPTTTSTGGSPTGSVRSTVRVCGSMRVTVSSWALTTQTPLWPNPIRVGAPTGI